MIKMLSRAGLSLCALALVGCDLLNRPSAAELNHCMTDKWLGTANMPLSRVVDWLDENGRRTSWQKMGPNTYALHIAYTDPRANVVTEMVVDISTDDAPAGKSACGPGRAVFERMNVNGEIFGYKAAAALFQQLIWKANESHPVGAPAAPAQQPVEPAEPATSNEMSLDEEAEADRQYYAEQNEKALKRPIMITDDKANLLCCITLRSIMNKLDAGGATVLISPSDDGSVQLQVEDPRGQWRGWRDYTLDFVPVSDGGPLLLSKVVNAGQVVAEMDGSGPNSTDQLLRDEFELKPTGERAR